MKKQNLFLLTIGSSLATLTVPLVILTSCNKEAEIHNVLVSNCVEKTTITSDKQSLGGAETEEIKLTIVNNRTNVIVDASLSIIIGDKHVNIPFAESLPVGTTELTYSKKTIQEKFTDYTIGKQDSFDFRLVRSGAYEVKENVLYQINDLGESIEATSEQIVSLEKKILVKDQETEDLILSTKTFASFVKEAPALTDNKKYDIYLLSGEYFSSSYERSLAACEFNVHGIIFNNQKTARIRVYKTIEEGMIWDYGIDVSSNIIFSFDNLIILGNEGKRASGESDISRGLMSTALKSYTNCEFRGCNTQWYGKVKYIDCTFDSTNTWKGDDAENGGDNYAIWINSDAQAWFENCTFTSGGKSIKFYPAGTNRVCVVNDCKFILDLESIQKRCGFIPELKSIFEIGTEELNNGHLDFYYKGLTIGEGFPADKIHYSGTLSSNVTEHAETIPEPW